MLVTAIGLVLLTGCVPTKPIPGPPTDAALRAVLDERIDKAWDNVGLEGVVERPIVQTDYSTSADSKAFTDCVTEVDGLEEGYIFSDGDNGVSVVGNDVLSDEGALAAYICFARFPFPMAWGVPMLTEEQAAHLYRHFREVLIPCLEMHGHHVTYIASTREILQFPGQSPYLAVNWATPAEYHDARRACGPASGGVAVAEIVPYSNDFRFSAGAW